MMCLPSTFPAKLKMTVCDCMPYQVVTVQGVKRDILDNFTLGEILSPDPGPAAQIKYFQLPRPNRSRLHL